MSGLETQSGVSASQVLDERVIADRRRGGPIDPQTVHRTETAIAVGEQELPEQHDGVWYVDFTSVAEVSQIAPAIAASLQLGCSAGIPWSRS